MKKHRQNLFTPLYVFTFLMAMSILQRSEGGTPLAAPQVVGPSLASSLLSVEQLPRFRPAAEVGSFSSYDRTGGNADGSSSQFLRREGDGLVIAELSGSGVITRIWTPAPIDAPIEFYFDGEATPRLALSFKQLFSGKEPPFVGTLTGHGLGGYYSYVPIEFAKSIKIIVRSENLAYYQVNYAMYEPAKEVRSFAPGDAFAIGLIHSDGTTVSRHHVLPANETITLFKSNRPGRIQSLRLGPAEALAGKGRDIILRIYWDGAQRPAVEVPVSDFFGHSFGQPAMRSLLLGTEDGWNYIHFPMPFERAAHIELASERRDGEPLRLRSEVIVSERGKTSDEGTFHADWRRENPTKSGRPFTYLDIAGRGHMVAAILQAQGYKPGLPLFFEGDDEAMIDGKVAIRGTGSEDAFNGGWYDIPGRWYGRGSLPFSGCLDYDKSNGRTGGYRLFIADAYSFHRSLRYTIEHGPEGNNIATDYVGVVFYYLDNPEGNLAVLPDSALRRIIDPEGFVLTFSPTSPPVAAMISASLELKQDQGIGSFVSAAPLDTTPNTDSWEVYLPPQLVLSVKIHKAGVYAISVDGLTGPSGAVLQLRVNDQPIGDAVDFYAPVPGKSGRKELAQIQLTEGNNLLHFALVGKNAQSAGTKIDLATIEGTRLR